MNTDYPKPNESSQNNEDKIIKKRFYSIDNIKAFGVLFSILVALFTIVFQIYQQNQNTKQKEKEMVLLLP